MKALDWIEIKTGVVVEVVYVAHSASLVRNIDTGASWMCSNWSLKTKRVICKY